MNQHIHEECGVFGIFAPENKDVAALTYYGLYALQHRGQEGCGIAVNDDGVITYHKDVGLVQDVFTPQVLQNLGEGSIAVGHTRYGTFGTKTRSNCQPMVVNHIKGRMALAHNGNIVNAAELRRSLELQGSIFHTTTDTEVISYTITKERLQSFVDYANRNDAVILYDAAYEAYISDPEIPHSIYECDGAKDCAIELRSFSKTAGFTGLRLGFTVIPKQLKAEGVTLWSLWARRHGTKYNGAPYIIQRAGEAVYSETGQREVRDQIGYYMDNARCIYEGLRGAGYEVSGGVNAPYIWLRTPDGLTSWEYFDRLLAEANVVGTPGSGFGPAGEHYFRLTAFGDKDKTAEAVRRIREM